MSAGGAADRRRARLAAARLYLVLPSAPPGADPSEHEKRLGKITRAAVAGGVDIVQLREKDRSDAELLELATDLALVCEGLGALFVVNDSPQLARAAGADGVHVGQDDMPVEDVRAIIGREMLIGLSTHARAEIDAVQAHAGDGSPLVDYIGVGPVHETPTKPGRPAVGAELVAYASTHARVPFFAIGGLDSRNLDEVLAAGATRAVILRAIAGADDPERAARELHAQLDAAAPPAMS
ncbi:MAG TPA: thiamine phosphate synthase [Solirubrobacteraceae bacterium]|nr:thiamine phosphate synthase [Solirubrobacteraceae bacterium]